MNFVMVDRILSLNPGKSIEAVKTLGADEELFRDHFPGFPVVPGVLLTEMMAQAGGKCLYAEDPSRGFPILVRVKDANFRSWAEPGKEIRLRCDVVTSAPAYATVKTQASVEGRRICAADLSYSFLPPDKLGGEEAVPEIFSLEGLDALEGHDHAE